MSNSRNGRIKSFIIAAIGMVFYYVFAVVCNKVLNSEIPTHFGYWTMLLFIMCYKYERVHVDSEGSW